MPEQGKGHGEIHLRGWYWPFDMLYSQGGNATMVRPPCCMPCTGAQVLHSCRAQAACTPQGRQLPVGSLAGAEQQLGCCSRGARV